MSSATWRPIVNYEGLYDVSDHGQVRSLPRTTTPGKVLRPDTSTDHHRVTLSKNGRHKRLFVGHLVAKAFIGQCPPGQELCHGPNGNLDDSLANVSWGTKSKNNGADKHRDGTVWARGEDVGGAKLTETDVIEIRRLAEAGVEQRIIASDYGVDPSTISLLIARKTWRWL